MVSRARLIVIWEWSDESVFASQSLRCLECGVAVSIDGDQRKVIFDQDSFTKIVMADIPVAHFPLLTEKNWNRWCAQMKVLLRYQGVSAIVEEIGGVSDLGGTMEQKEEIRRKDDKALFIIHQCVDDVHFEKIQNASTAKEAWNILVRCHAGGEKVKKVKL